MESKPQKPLPPDLPLSRPYWEAARRGDLVVQRCAACGKLRHYPRLMCDACHSLGVQWQPLSRRGSIHSWTVCHHPFHAAFRDEVPYTLVTVDLEEGVRALGRWTGGAPTIGLPVSGRFERDGERAELIFAPL